MSLLNSNHETQQVLPVRKTSTDSKHETQMHYGQRENSEASSVVVKEMERFVH